MRTRENNLARSLTTYSFWNLLQLGQMTTRNQFTLSFLPSTALGCRQVAELDKFNTGFFADYFSYFSECEDLNGYWQKARDVLRSANEPVN
jgi:hypothetical protein